MIPSKCISSWFPRCIISCDGNTRNITEGLDCVGPPTSSRTGSSLHRALLRVAVDDEQCRRIFTGAPSSLFGPSGFTWFSLSFTITAVWFNAAPALWMTRLLGVWYFGHGCALFFVSFAPFRFGLAGFSLFWLTLLAVRRFSLLRRRLAC